MSTARLHAEWLNLIDISGPFLTIDVLSREFPQGLYIQDTPLRGELKSVYEEWREDQQSHNPTPALHARWVEYVLDTVLDHIPGTTLAKGQAIPADLKLVNREFGEIRPQHLVHNADEPAQARLLVTAFPSEQPLERQVRNSASAASPATQMMELLHATDVRLGLVTNGKQWMLVHAKPGETTSFISWYADLWIQEKVTLQAFVSLLGVYRFFGVDEPSTLEALMAESADAQHEITDQLGYQVREAVEILIQAIDRIDRGRNHELLVDVNEPRLYEAALTVMMRLVFLMSAEERELLLLGDPVYDQHYAVTTLRAQLREIADQYGEEILERRFDAWSRLLAVFRAVHGGIAHADLRLPAYGGSLFDPDRFPFLEGRAEGSHWRASNAVPLTIDNRTTLHLLEALQILRVKIPGGGTAEARRLSFRALSVTQIGHVYEGLLDHEARRADDYVLGFVGTKKTGDPEIPLSELEALPDREALEKFIKDATGSSPSAIRNRLDNDPDPERVRRLRLVCRDDADLFDRALPYLNLTRDDDRGKPYIVFPGSIYVTAGATRRSTGTHYTPESLTQPIVKHTLEPLVYRGPAEGWDEADWQLKSPAELLELKVCDMAMGSGAFLVQVVEYLSDRLLEAWEQVLNAPIPNPSPSSGQGNTDSPSPAAAGAEGNLLQITPDGSPATGRPGETIIPRDNDLERATIAKRLVADRCIYGVDKNPLAVEMAKLSLWLITLSKGRAFTFLDHALKCGDSLVGVSIEQLRYWKLQPERNNKGEIIDAEQMVGRFLTPAIDYAVAKRQQLESSTVVDVKDQQVKAALYAEAEAATAYLKAAADHLIAEAMGVSEGSVLADVIATFKAIEGDDDLIAALRDHPLPPPGGLDFDPFHWELEYPEVFQRGGFDAFVGNPPFIGGRRIRENLGDLYRASLYVIYPGSSGNADYCTFFFLQGFNALRHQGTIGLIATNTIGQGDTRVTGLDSILGSGGTIFHAQNDKPWPGQAAVFVNVVHIARNSMLGPFMLDGRKVDYISSTLDDQPFLGNPYTLHENDGKSHMGTNVVGMGFTVTPDEADHLRQVNQRNSKILFPFINGQDLNSSPTQSASRWIINFFDWTLDKSEMYVECMKIVRENVKPQRDKSKRKPYREKWWQFAERQKNLYEAIAGLDRTLIIAQTSNTLAFSFVSTSMIYSHSTIVISSDSYAVFSTLQSNLHHYWILKYSSSLKGDASYRPTDAFQTFPFPADVSPLETIGETHHETRRQIMLARQEGLTTTYNRFHDPDESAEDIAGLRALHVEMDNAVAAAYGWDDLDLGHDFHETAQGVRYTISEAARREVLTRLLKLNHQRYAEECDEGLHKQKDCAAFFAEHPEYQRKSRPVFGSKQRPAGDKPEQQDLFDDDNPQKRLF